MSYRKLLKTKKPFSVQIGGHEIKVRFVKGLREQQSCVGAWYESQMLIELDSDLTPDNAYETLMHEVFHAASDLHGLRLSENKVRLLGISLHQVLRPFLKGLK